MLHSGPGAGSAPRADPTRPTPCDERVVEVLRRLAPRPPRDLRPEHRLHEDLGFDSLALVKTVVALEDALDVELPQERLHELRHATVADACALVRAALVGPAGKRP
jgi:acyl carrier protein